MRHLLAILMLLRQAQPKALTAASRRVKLRSLTCGMINSSSKVCRVGFKLSISRLFSCWQIKFSFSSDSYNISFLYIFQKQIKQKLLPALREWSATLKWCQDRLFEFVFELETGFEMELQLLGFQGAQWPVAFSPVPENTSRLLIKSQFDFTKTSQQFVMLANFKYALANTYMYYWS